VNGPVGAVELGGTHVTAARVQGDRVVPGSRAQRPLRPDGDRAELLDAILGAAVAAGRPEVDRWGVAVPGPFDYQRGICTIRGVAKLEALHGVDLRAELARALGLADGGRVRFLNDADAFLLGEWRAGAARGQRRCVGVTLGTGLGSAFLADGRIRSAGAGVPPEGRLDLLSFRGRPVEETISRRGLLARYRARRPDADPALDVEQVAARARAGDPAADDTFAETMAALGELLAPWLFRFEATGLVVGGSIARAWDLIEPALAPALAGLPDLEVVARAANLDDAALLGAAAHASGAGGDDAG
jgi:glucokinase